MRLIYPVDLEHHREGPSSDHTILVRFPDLPEAITSGDTIVEALANASDCLEEALAWRIAERTDIPTPSPANGRHTAAPGSRIAAKAALYSEMRANNVRPAELARRMGVSRAAITGRLLDPKHASKPEQFDAAFAALGKRLVMDVEATA